MTTVRAIAVAMLTVVGGAVAQEKVDEQRIAELIGQLDDADQLKRDTAVHQLAGQGRPAALMLKNMLEEGDSIDIALLPPLRRMGPDAVECLPLLFDAFEREEDPKTLTAICHAILGIVPFMVMDNAQLHDGRALVMRAQDTVIRFTRGVRVDRIENGLGCCLEIQRRGRLGDQLRRVRSDDMNSENFVCLFIGKDFYHSFSIHYSACTAISHEWELPNTIFNSCLF